MPPLLALATIALLTGGLHLDGLADFADGLGSRRPAAEALAIMKDSAIGALGAADADLRRAARRRPRSALAVEPPPRHGRLADVRAGRPAGGRPGVPPRDPRRPRRTGSAPASIGSVSALRAAVVTVAVFVVAAIAGKLDYDGGRLRESVHAMFAVLCAVVVAALVRRLAVRRLGGLTGDVFGALIEIAVVVDLVVMVGAGARLAALTPGRRAAR